MNHKSFRIRAQLLTPVRLGQFPVALDKLLWHCLFLRYGDEARARDELDSLLHREGRVFFASTLRFGTYNGSPLVATKSATVGAMRAEADLDPSQFHWKKRGDKWAKIQLEGGPYKNRLAKFETYFAPELVWDAVGNGERVSSLLNYFVTGIGLDANRGFGAVKGFSAVSLEQDYSLFDEEGQVARVIPASMYEKQTKKKADPADLIRGCLVPPFRGLQATEEELCIAPERVRRVRLTPRN